MMKKSKKITVPISSANPFTDSQARNYSGEKVLTEFCPISKYWSLFNDQHELIVGSRGCGKTLLLKMMRYSMLSKLTDDRAKKLTDEKSFIAFYVPLHLEYIKKLSDSTLSKKLKVSWFRFSFNCLLAQSIIIEISQIISDLKNDDFEKINLEYIVANDIDKCWGIMPDQPVFQFEKLRDKVDKLYYTTDPLSQDLDKIPYSFMHSLGSSLSSISNILCDALQISPTWIVCVDEAEFAEECYQECINTVFRSDTGRIAFKVATLHFYHKTRLTLDDNISVMDGQDFKCTIVDMKHDDPDYVSVTDSLVRTRLASVDILVDGLRDILETIGTDNYIDYYSKEMKYDKYPRELLEEGIISQLSNKSKNHNADKSQQEIKKPVIDKLAPIFYMREIYKLTKTGSRIPGWYAGVSMARRISQGNPRVFIRIMSGIFDSAKGKKLPLAVKQQHKCMMDFAESFCKETQTLEKIGPEAKQYLEYIAKELHNQSHQAEIRAAGTTFIINKKTDTQKHKVWLEKAVAFSRLTIDEGSLKTQIDAETVYQLSNTYAAAYWIPMRVHSSPSSISLPENVDFTYKIRKSKDIKEKTNENEQISLFAQGEI